MSGVRSGVNGTPTFFINGVRHDDSYETEVLVEALSRLPQLRGRTRERNLTMRFYGQRLGPRVLDPAPQPAVAELLDPARVPFRSDRR